MFFLSGGLSPEGKDTTHISVIDRRGMAVGNTYTLERLWGSRIVVQGAGFLLNNEMRTFNLFPGPTDRRATSVRHPTRSRRANDPSVR